MSNKALLINIYGASGVGKSIAATTIANALKLGGINAEYCREWVKEEMLLDKDFWKSHKSDQKNIVISQYHLLAGMLSSGADVIVTDSPLLHTKLYGTLNNDWNEGCQDYLDNFNKYFDNQINILLVHEEGVAFQQFGRNEDLVGSLSNQEKLRTLMKENGLAFTTDTLQSLVLKRPMSATTELFKTVIKQHNSKRTIGEIK